MDTHPTLTTASSPLLPVEERVKVTDPKVGSQAILDNSDTNADARFAIGNTIVFYTHKLETLLEDRLFEELARCARVIQRLVLT